MFASFSCAYAKGGVVRKMLMLVIEKDMVSQNSQFNNRVLQKFSERTRKIV